MDRKDAVAVVTGSASGIGLAIARALKDEGYRVIISDRNVTAGEKAAHELSAEFRECDVSDEAAIGRLFDGLGTVRVLVNNAGISGPTAALSDMEPAAWREVMDVNLTAAFLTCRRVVPGMVEARDGIIINMSSAAGRIGYANRSPYCASKWGILGLTAALAREVGEHGVRVNAILPAAVRGPLIESVIANYAKKNGIGLADAEAHYLGRQATRRFIEPEEIGAMAAYLCSDAARSITGQFIGIDGGFE